ncbi:MAG: hypothetical protein JWM44_2236 [Bacilli bacterium]|nr:hypothetical protein [Bacilli bacterium]
MKKPFAKKIIMGAMALTLIGGSGVVLISKNAFAATPTAPAASVAPQKDNQNNHSWEGIRGVNDQLLAFLKLDKTTFKTKSATETLAQIATDQGISREALKAELTTEENAKLDKEKADFATNIDKTVDSIQKGEHGDRAGKNHEGAKIDLSGTATLLGFSSAADLKAALVPGKSIADLATEKGVAVQSVIDLQVTQITKILDQKLADKKITQAQYDKQKANITKIATNIVNDKQDDNNKQDDKEVNNGATTPATPATK